MGETNTDEPKNEIRSYKEIALFYNYLMRSIDYKKWAKYIYEIYRTVKIEGQDILEIAAGTCALSQHLVKKFPNLIVTDRSFDMLLTTENFDDRRVVCDMTALPFKNRYDFIFSTFDSINYLTEEEYLKKMFDDIYLVLKDEGIFTFDVSLERNSIRYEKSLNRKGKFQGIKFIQESIYDRDNKLHSNGFKIRLSDGTVVEELHKQRIYEIEDYFRLADDAGLIVLDCFEAFTFNDLNEKTERAQFIIKRK